MILAGGLALAGGPVLADDAVSAQGSGTSGAAVNNEEADTNAAARSETPAGNDADSWSNNDTSSSTTHQKHKKRAKSSFTHKGPDTSSRARVSGQAGGLNKPAVNSHKKMDNGSQGGEASVPTDNNGTGTMNGASGSSTPDTQQQQQ
jgi:hypothetical protein